MYIKRFYMFNKTKKIVKQDVTNMYTCLFTSTKVPYNLSTERHTTTFIPSYRYTTVSLYGLYAD